MSAGYPLKLSIVITTRNRVSCLKECLQSISIADIPFAFELIVVDDASSDGTPRIDATSFSIENVRIVRNATQVMMVRARNQGGRLAKGELVLFVDDDNVIAPDMIANLVRFADDCPEYGIIGPVMAYYPSKKVYLNFQKINLFNGRTSGRLDFSGAGFCDSDGIPNVFMVRKKVLEQCGYFDESIVQTYTEPDLAFYARRMGAKCAMVKNALTCHHVSETLGVSHLGGGEFCQKAYFLMRNRMVMVVRYGRWYHQCVYLLLFSWMWPLLYTVLVLRERRFDLVRMYWIGFWDGVKYFFSRKLDDPDSVIDKIRKFL